MIAGDMPIIEVFAEYVIGAAPRPIKQPSDSLGPPAQRRCDHPGGAGFGDPSDRKVGRVAEDVLEERISVSFAKEHYGWEPDSSP